MSTRRATPNVSQQYFPVLKKCFSDGHENSTLEFSISCLCETFKNSTKLVLIPSKELGLNVTL